MENIPQLQENLIQYEDYRNEFNSRVDVLTDPIENAAAPHHWIDRNGIIIWANQAELDAFGFSKEEYIGFHVSNFHADQQVIADILFRLTNNETLHNYPARLICKDGTIKHVLISSNGLRKAGEFIHTRCFTRDITAIIKEDKRKADLLFEVKKSEDRLRMAIASANLGTWDWDPVTNNLYSSDECKKIHGLLFWQSVDLEAFESCIHPDDRLFVQQEIQRSLNRTGNKEYNIIYRILRFNDYNVRWVKVQGKVYFNEDGLVKRFIGTVMDITDLKEAEEKSAKLAAIIESSDDAIVSNTLDGVITSWNNSAERTFGYKAEEMVGQSILKLIPYDRQHEEAYIVSRLKKGERVEHFETKRLARSGKLLDISLTISPVKDPHGTIIGLSKVARDISEKKQEEQRKNDFVAMVSHELKTPLTSITAYLQLLARREADEHNINTILRAQGQTKKMISMIQDFLNVARLEEGRMQINKEEFALHELMEEITKDAEFLTSRHTIKLMDCQEITVNADRDKIGQVLTNLLSNAIKYSPAGGAIFIGCEKLEEKVKIFVSDEGIGISEAHQKRLFERFYRVSDDTIKTVSGFGIGLYLVSEILRYHNSKIEVESEQGSGSTFHFCLAINKNI